MRHKEKRAEAGWGRVVSHGLLTAVLLLFLTGCNDIQLYTNMPEQHVNEMMAVLLNHGLPAQKKSGEKGTWNLVVDKSMFAPAMDVLLSNGYPRTEFDSLGDMYKRQGLVSSPREERVRFTFALSQSIAKSISKIDGVTNARVHIVIPEPNPLLDSQSPTSAAVFVKHVRHSNINAYIPQIKQLVQNSIEGLTYERVSVVLFPTDEPPDLRKAAPEVHSILGIQVLSGSVSTLRLLLIALMGLLLASWVAAGAYWFHFRKKT